MTDETRVLAEALPCEDPEEPCDADGRDEHRWCDNCIARSVLSRTRGYSIVPTATLERARRIEEAAREWVAAHESVSEPSASSVIDGEKLERYTEACWDLLAVVSQNSAALSDGGES